MAVGTLYGTNKTLQRAGGDQSWTTPGLLDGRVKAIFETYVTTGSNEDSTSTIELPTLPKGANIVDVILAVPASLTSSVTLSVGDKASATRYHSSQSTASATVAHCTTPAAIGYIIGTATNDQYPIITIGGANNSASAKTIGVVFLYTLD